MNRVEYLKYGLSNGLANEYNWFLTLLAIRPKERLKNEYLVVENNKYKIIGLENEYLDDVSIDKPIFHVSDKLSLKTGDILNVIIDIEETTLGRVIFNYMVLSRCFGKKIPYINSSKSVKDIENEYISDLLTDKKEDDGKLITIPEYTKYFDACAFLENFSRIVSISATEKNMLPPTGITEYSKKVIKEMKAEFGEDCFKDYSKVVMFETKLLEFDAEFLKDDPSYGKIVSGKMKNIARKRLFLAFGAEAGFDKDGEAKMVFESLVDGWPQDVNKLANMFNSSRHGSYGRGAETKDGGVTAKYVLRALGAFKVEGEDCGVKYGDEIEVTKDIVNTLVGIYRIESGKPILMENRDAVNKLLGKKIEIRTTSYCKAEGSRFCKTCAGKALSDYPTGISISGTDISSSILLASMGAMHGKQLSTVEFNIFELLS